MNITPRGVVIAISAFVVVAQQSVRDEPRFGNGPWVFIQHSGRTISAPGTHYSPKNQDLGQVRLDDGTRGRISVTPAPCGPGDTCGSADCGCHAVDRHLLAIINASGAPIARSYVWAAYGRFDIMSADLTGGVGDELLIVRALGRSVPPNGLELKILQVAGHRLIELLGAEQIAANLGGTPMVCGQWRRRVTVEADGSKPHMLWMRNEVIVPPNCTLDEPQEAAARRAEVRRLVFERGRYTAR